MSDRRDVGARGRGRFKDQREAEQSLHEGDCEVCQSVDQEVIPQGRGWDWGPPVQGEVEGEEAPCEGTGGVVCPEDGQRRERGGKSGHGRLVGGGGASYANGRQVSPVFAVRIPWG